MYKLHTENFSGNLHEVSTTINRLGLAKYVLVMDRAGDYTVVVFKMPRWKVHALRRANPSYAVAVNHDDRPFWPRLHNALKCARYAEGYGAGKRVRRSVFWKTFAMGLGR